MSKNSNSTSNSNQTGKPHGQLVEDFMSRDPITIAPHANLNMAAHIMWTQERGCLPVVEENGRVLGILTDRDIAMCSYTQGRPLAELPVRLAMQTEVVCARVGDDREVVEALMEANDIHRLPVLDEEGLVVGIVSRADLDAPMRERAREAFTMQVARTPAQMSAMPAAPRNGSEAARS